MRLGRRRRRRLVTSFVVLALGAELRDARAATDDSVRARAERLASTGRCEEALPLLAEAGRIDPNDARVPLVTGQCQVRLKRYPEAVQSLERAKALDPGLADVDLSLGIAQFHAGSPADAEASFAAARAAGSSRPELDFYEGMTKLQLGRFETSTAESLERAAIAKPDTLDPVASYYAGLAWQRAQEREKAKAALQRVIDNHPGTSWAEAAERTLQDMEEGESSLWVRLQAGMEYDSNVIFRGAGVTVPSDIGGQADGRGVWAVEVGSEPLRSKNWTLGLRASYYGSAHFDLHDFDLQYPGGSIWLDRRMDDASLMRIEYGFYYAWLGYEPYVATQLLTPQFFHNFGRYGVSRFYTQFAWNNFFVSDADVPPGEGVGTPCPPATGGFCGPAGIDEHQARNRDGILYTWGIDHSLTIADARTNVTAGPFMEYNDTRGSEYTYAGYGGQLSTLTQLPFAFVFSSRFVYVYRSFANPSTFPDPQDPNVLLGLQYAANHFRRREHFAEVDLSLERRITDNLTASLRYDYLRNHSNTPVFDYDRQLVGGYLTFFWRH